MMARPVLVLRPERPANFVWHLGQRITLGEWHAQVIGILPASDTHFLVELAAVA